MRIQLWIALAIVVIGGGALGGEYFLVKWYPRHQEHVADKTLKLLPYRNDGLGIEMQVASGLYGKIESFPGGVKIYRTAFLGVGPSLTITAQPNPDDAFEFSPQILAKWEAQGVTDEIPDYHFERMKINQRDAVIISQYKDRSLLLTAHVISPERIVEADCSPGTADRRLFMEACRDSLETLKVAGPEPPPPKPLSLQPVGPSH